MDKTFRIHFCHTCHEPLARAGDKADHVFRGHDVETIVLVRRLRRQGEKVGVQWSSEWVVADRKDALL